MFSLGPDNQPLAGSRVSDTIAGGYTQIPQKYYHPNASRNALGLFGGNEVSQASGNLVDIESDLMGTTRDLSAAPSRKYQPSSVLGSLGSVGSLGCDLAPLKGDSRPSPIVFTERSTGKVKTVSTQPRHLPTTQMFSYPGVPAPEPLVQEVYGYPWRF
jgi:hypothetical protein